MNPTLAPSFFSSSFFFSSSSSGAGSYFFVGAGVAVGGDGDGGFTGTGGAIGTSSGVFGGAGTIDSVGEEVAFVALVEFVFVVAIVMIVVPSELSPREDDDSTRRLILGVDAFAKTEVGLSSAMQSKRHTRRALSCDLIAMLQEYLAGERLLSFVGCSHL